MTSPSGRNEYPTEPIVDAGELPDAFAFPDGRRVRTREEWPACAAAWRDLVLNMEYGGLPPPPDAIEVETLSHAGVSRWPGAPRLWIYRIRCRDGQPDHAGQRQCLLCWGKRRFSLRRAWRRDSRYRHSLPVVVRPGPDALSGTGARASLRPALSAGRDRALQYASLRAHASGLCVESSGWWELNSRGRCDGEPRDPQRITYFTLTVRHHYAIVGTCQSRQILPSKMWRMRRVFRSGR
jgi:hypothetical protein